MTDHAHDDGLAGFWAPNVPAARTGILVGLATLAVYAATAGTFVGSHDPAQFQTLARTGGIAHAGYPTVVLLLQLFAHLPFGTLPFKANLFSAVSGAAAAGLAAYIGTRLTRSALAGAASAAAFALSFTLWEESTHAGVHSFTLALDATILLLALRFARVPGSRVAFAIGALFGIALTSHLTCLSLAFPLAAVAFLTARRGALRASYVASTVGGVAVGLLPFLYLLAMDQATQPMNYLADSLDPALVSFAGAHPSPPQRLERFTWLLSGRQYLLDGGFDALGSLPRRSANLMLDLVLNEFPFGTALLAAFGLALVVLRRDAVALVLAAWVVGAAAFVAVGATPLMSRIFFLPGSFVLALGLAAAVAALRRRGVGLAAGLALLLVAAPLTRVCVSAPPPGLPRATMITSLWGLVPAEWSPFVNDRSWDEYGRGVMARLPPGAVVLTCWREATVLRYFVFGETLRPDVQIAYACGFAPRFQRMAREAQAAGRPVFSSYEPGPALLGEHGHAERMWSHAYGGLWRVTVSPSNSRE